MFVVDNLQAEGLLDGKAQRLAVAVTVTAASILALTVASEHTQTLTGSTAGQSVRMPDATTLTNGHRFEVINAASVSIALVRNGGTAIATLLAGQRAMLVLRDGATAAGVWDIAIVERAPLSPQLFVQNLNAGAGLTLNYNAGNVVFNGTLTPIAAGTIAVPGSTTNGYVYADLDGTVKATAALPIGAVPMALFTSDTTTVTALADRRVDLSRNLVWGLAADISKITSQATKAAGTSEKFARADHVHDTNLLKNKAGVALSSAFTGNPKKATITFGTAFANANYAISLEGTDARGFTYESKTAAGFVINANANLALTGDVHWTATATGEAD
jgi:hypothetical protein